MKVSRKWLQKYFDAELPSAEALALALTFHAFEIEEIIKAGNDEVLEVKITANRGHDCLSHRGIAKELSAILQLPLSSDPLSEKPDLSKTTNTLGVKVQSPLCLRYIAGHMRGVTVAPSPKWLKERLEALGQRSVNNIVDATNFVMFNLGQPLHAFNAEMIQSRTGTYDIGVRTAKEGEKLVGLDGKAYELLPSMLVITDDEGGDAPIGIAGVKGGLPAAITESTKDIIIESANFDGPSVRKTAAALKLRTDASSRFEQVISPELAAYGMQSVVELILKVAGGDMVGYVDVYPNPQEPSEVSVSVSRVEKLLGKTFGEKEIENAFTRLGFQFTQNGEDFTVVVPFERLDLRIPEDLVEELGRIIGYDHVEALDLPATQHTPAVNANFYAAEVKRQELLSQGYSEVLTSVFAEKGERVVLNKVDGVRPYLRSSLADGLTDALKKNIPNKELLGLAEMKLFEIGTVWNNGAEEIMVGSISEKEQAAEAPLVSAEAPERYRDLPLSEALRYQPFSRFPYIVRDVAAWVPERTDEKEVLAFIKEKAGGLALKASLFDRFEKGGRVSLAFRLIFQSFERTLEDREANEAMEKVYEGLRARGFEIR